MLKGKKCQKGSAQHFDHAQHQPSRSSDQHTDHPAATVHRGGLRHEAEVIRLLPHLGDDCHGDSDGRTEKANIEVDPIVTAITEKSCKILRPVYQQKQVGQAQHDQPDGLGQGLQAADRCNASCHKGDHYNGTDQVTPDHRNVEGKLERGSHDGRFKREENKSECGINE